MSLTTTHSEISLSDAALRLKRGYLATREMALRGELDARRDARGRWMVTEESVERVLRSPAA